MSTYRIVDTSRTPEALAIDAAYRESNERLARPPEETGLAALLAIGLSALEGNR